MSTSDESLEFLTLVDQYMHSYIPLTAFMRACSVPASSLSPRSDMDTSLLAAPAENCFWEAIIKTIDKAHKHYVAVPVTQT